MKKQMKHKKEMAACCMSVAVLTMQFNKTNRIQQSTTATEYFVFKAGSHQDILVAATSGGHQTCRRMCQCDRVSFQLTSSRQVSLLQEEILSLGHTCDLQVEGKFSGLHQLPPLKCPNVTQPLAREDWYIRKKSS